MTREEELSNNEETKDAGGERDDHPHHRGWRDLLNDGVSKGYAKSKEEMLKGKLYVQHQLGLGHQPNVVPPAKPTISGDYRTVEIGWHAVAGIAGKWFAEKTGLGQMITRGINHYPDPTQHWAVLVGEYAHELWMDEHLDIIYINEKVKKDEWQTFPVGRTRFNDEALRRAGEMVIFNMREKKAAYNLISNNCQNFAMNLLGSIQVGKHKEFATSLAVYETALSSRHFKDLFSPGETVVDDPNLTEGEAGAEHDNVMEQAQNVIQENTSSISVHNPR